MVLPARTYRYVARDLVLPFFVNLTLGVFYLWHACGAVEVGLCVCGLLLLLGCGGYCLVRVLREIQAGVELIGWESIRDVRMGVYSVVAVSACGEEHTVRLRLYRDADSVRRFVLSKMPESASQSLQTSGWVTELLSGAILSCYVAATVLGFAGLSYLAIAQRIAGCMPISVASMGVAAAALIVSPLLNAGGWYWGRNIAVASFSAFLVLEGMMAGLLATRYPQDVVFAGVLFASGVVGFLLAGAVAIVCLKRLVFHLLSKRLA